MASKFSLTSSKPSPYRPLVDDVDDDVEWDEDWVPNPDKATKATVVKPTPAGQQQQLLELDLLEQSYTATKSKMQQNTHLWSLLELYKWYKLIQDKCMKILYNKK